MRKRASASGLFWLVITFSISTGLAAEDPDATRKAAGAGTGESLTELNKKLTNPVSDFWSISFQQNNFRVSTLPGQADRWNSNLNFQPMLPVALTRNWNLVTRPVIPLFDSRPYPATVAGPPLGTEVQKTTGLGDMALSVVLSPNRSLCGNWLLGVGPTFVFPTATSVHTGAGKWQAGPALLFGYLSKRWILASFTQNWTSFAGDGSRPDANSMNLQPIAAWFFPHGWSVGYSGNILANWQAEPGQVWTVPLGIGVGKVVRVGQMPVKIGLAGQWMPVHPDDFGQKWDIQLFVAPIIPKLVKNPLFD